MILSLLQSRKPHPIQIAGVKFKYFCGMIALGMILVVGMTIFVLLVQTMVF
jgi:hypothetical protein